MPTTDHELSIAATVLDLAHRSTDFDPLELLHDLTAQTHALLPVRWTSVTVLDPMGGSDQVLYVTASDEQCRQLVETQLDLDEGPCLDSSRSQQLLPLTLLSQAGQARWPRFTTHARAMGITAAAAVSLRLPHLQLGALNLFMTGPPYVSTQDLRLAQILANATATALSHRNELADKQKVISQLQTALDSRIVIEQAKGILSARLGIGIDEAFTLLRAHARNRQQKITVLATRIAQGDVPTELDPTR
ncbi:GAF and ANTAR domain-containing protein [Streptomyces sp. NPDC047071]|uniref:GAF and ANTAR domain-containing protein n=1 Tax=Streptomyces sp. NPDC047071 TaxID=3154808 RepID=UPI003451FC22